MSPPQVGFNHKAVLILSIIQLSCGVLSMLLGGIQIGVRTPIAFTGYGFWTGLFFIIAGILGIISWKYKKSCNIVGHMVMSIIACLFAWLLLGFAATTVGIYNVYFGCYGSICAHLVLGAVLLIISLLEIVVSIVSSAFCCKAVCCGTRSSGYIQGATMQYVSPDGGQPGQQVIVMAPGSYPQQGYVMQPGHQPAYQMQVTVPQGSQMVYNQGQPAPQGQIAYNAPAVPQGQIVYNVQPVPQGQNATAVSPPAYMDRTQTQDEHKYDCR